VRKGTFARAVYCMDQRFCSSDTSFRNIIAVRGRLEEIVSMQLEDPRADKRA
jgi:hypothetical protein